MNRRKKMLFTYALVLFCCTIAVIVVVISVKYNDAEALVAHLPVNRTPGNGVYVRDLLQNKWKFYAAVPPPPVKDREENAKVIILGPKDIPDVVRKTILFQEDKQFGEHHGVDLPAVLRALINNFFSDSLQGASTITEQLVKHLVGKARKEDRTYVEKMREMLVAYALESKYSKEEIFVAYCNMLPLHAEGGVIITGIGQGFKSYYNKNLTLGEVPTLGQAAHIAAMLNAPALKTPGKLEGKAARDNLLDRMLAAGVIKPAEAAAAKSEPDRITSQKLDIREAPWFLNPIALDLYNRLNGDVDFSKLRVYATLSPALQAIATKNLQEWITYLRKTFYSKLKEDERESLNGAVVIIDPETGRVLALVGGVNYEKNQFNCAINASRQFGSAYKPIGYVAGLESRRPELTLGATFIDTKSGVGSYHPANYDKTYTEQPYSVHKGIVHSKNTIAAQYASTLGFDAIRDIAMRLGLPAPPNDDLSCMLGTQGLTLLDMTAAYAAFVRGEYAKPRLWETISYVGNDTPIFTQKEERRQIISLDAAFVLTEVLQDVVDYGTAHTIREAGYEGPAAGKTGTTDNYTNAAFIGYTPKLVVGVEIFFQGKKERSLGKTGGQLAAPLWARIMKDIAGPDGTSGKFAFLAPPFPDETGLDVEKRKCDGNTVWFIKGTVPENACKDSDNPLEHIIQAPEKIGEKIREGIEKIFKP
jgi:membrane peptidoglycan carboxypeptidase